MRSIALLTESEKLNGIHPSSFSTKANDRSTEVSQVRKGKRPMDQSPSQSTPMSFIIWNVRGANIASFRCQCDVMVKLHKPDMLVLLETRLGEHKILTEVLKFDS